ncbi:hypothetical protein niasHS_002463 [Heterodera schachtii]|uniref:Uncharacterized protein n=1 Tax=Heterodera schachtii TaxID=97005 RepID=A0ABD2KK07_HETSC
MAGKFIGGRMPFRQSLLAPSFLTVSPLWPFPFRPNSASSHARVFDSEFPSSHSPKLRCVLSANNKTNLRARRYHHPRPQLVIFDKDGTLICFHSLWVPWVRSFAEKVEEAGIDGIAPKVFHALGFCPVLKKVKRGLLAEGTMRQIRDRVVHLLVQNGLERGESLNVVEKAIHGTSEVPFAERTVRQLHDLEGLFARLKELGIKIAICTADSRAGTTRVLKTLKVEQFVDLIVCGDDKGSVPKPQPDNALFICRQLGVDPKNAMVIGDTPADLGMGRSAKLGSIVGVLSGIGEHKELNEADHLVEHVGELLPLIG